MRFFAVVAALVSAVAAETFTVAVGGNSTITYNPTSINASVGDVVQFQFQSKNHTLTQSTFAAPCTPMAGGVTSGFQPVSNTSDNFPVFSMTLTNTSAPLWFFCEQTGHCANDGMVFAINPTAAKSFEAFQAAALATGNSTNSTTASTSASASTASSTDAASSGTTASADTGSSGASASAAAPSTSASAVGGASTGSTNGASPLRIGVSGLVAVLGLSVGLLL